MEKITPGAVARFFFEPPRTLGACPWCSPIGLPALAAIAEFYARLGERSDGLAYTRWFRQVKRFRRALGGDRGPLWLFAPVAPSSACAHEVGLEALRATSKRALCNVLEQMIRAEGWLFKGHRGRRFRRYAEDGMMPGAAASKATPGILPLAFALGRVPYNTTRIAKCSMKQID